MKKSIILLLFFNVVSTSFYAQHVGIGTEDPHAMLDINGDVVFRTGDLFIMDSLTLSLDVNTDRFSSYRIWVSGPYDTCVIAGLTVGMDGRVVTLYNRNSYIPFQLNNEDVTALPGSGIMTGTNENLFLPGGGMITMQYDTSVQRWVVKSSNLAVQSAVSSEWLVRGNTGTNPDSNFLGTIDSMPLRFRLFNSWAGEFNAGTRNYFIGDSTGIANTTGYKNVGIGSRVLAKNAVGNWNTAAGSEALHANTSGNYNAAFGFSALESTTIGSENSAFGTQALRYNQGGSFNTAIGTNAQYSNISGIGNTSVGYASMVKNKYSNFNTAIGIYALWNHRVSDLNTAIGYFSLFSDTSGIANTAIGSYTLTSNINGMNNTAVGNKALYNNNGSRNTAVGDKALANNLLSSNNVAIGDSAIYSQFGALGFNTAIGSKVMASNREGYSNTAVGYATLYLNQNGYANTAFGQGSLYYLINGQNNIGIGYGSGTDPGSPNVNNTISIGNDDLLNAASNQAFLGNQSTIWIGGQVTWSTYSDARVKTNVQEDVKGLDFIKRLRPVTYYRSIKAMTDITGNTPTEDYPGKYDIEKIKFTGFLAQEVEEAAKEANYGFSGITIPKSNKELYTLSYEQFVVPLVKGMQEQQAMIENQQRQIEELLKRIDVLEKE